MKTIVLLLVISVCLIYVIIKFNNGAKKDKEKIQQKRIETGNKFYQSRNESVDYFVDVNPTKPMNFGRKIDWLAIKSTHHEAIVNEFRGLNSKAIKTNMKHGVNGAYAGYIFIFPPISNWTLVAWVGYFFNDEKSLNFLKTLSQKFCEVQYFLSFRGSGSSSWIKCVNGDVVRAYSVADCETYLDIGKMTAEEKQFTEIAISKAFDQEERDWIKGEGRLACLSDEKNVLNMAALWSVNPDKIDDMQIMDLGTIIKR